MSLQTIPRAPFRELWSRAVEDPRLRDLPYKVETNEYGQLVLSPHKLRHSYYQKRIADLLRAHLERYAAAGKGEWMMEFAVETAGGVKVPDVVWISEARWAAIPEDAEASAVCPELVVEVLSRSKTTAEMDDKRRLYFEAGAHEFWTCDMNGRMRFFGPAGELAPSEMVPDFPTSIA